MAVRADLYVKEGLDTRIAEVEDFGVDRTGAGKETTQLELKQALLDAVDRLTAIAESLVPEMVTSRTFDDDNNVLTEVMELASGTTRTWTYAYEPGNPIPVSETYVDA